MALLKETFGMISMTLKPHDFSRSIKAFISWQGLNQLSHSYEYESFLSW